MGQKIKSPRELLNGCFTSLEWDYLAHHKDFKIELKNGCKSLDDFERLSTLGGQLLAEREIANPNNPPSPHPRTRKRN